jgi:hypothetical protein
MVREERRQGYPTWYPTPLFFFVEECAIPLKEKSCDFGKCKKKCRRVRKNLKRNEIGGLANRRWANDCSLLKDLPPTPTNLQEYQKKGLTKFAFHKRLTLNGTFFS